MEEIKMILWKHTWVLSRETPHLNSMRAMVRTLIPMLRWRRHGIGCIQAYVQQGNNEEYRIHIWHPKAKRDGIVDRGDIHDHRFDLTSIVLLGSIEHTEMGVWGSPNGDYDMYSVVHHRADPGARYQKIEGRYRLNPLGGDMFPGTTYTFDKGAFHRTRANGLAITMVKKTNQEERDARVMCYMGQEPVHAFEPLEDFDYKEVLRDAMAALSVAL